MGTPICDPKLLVKPSTSSEALAALDEAQHQIIAGEVAQLVAITHIADLWKIDQTVVAEGMEQLIRPGHDGTPKVGEFVAAEVGALLGLPRSTALSRIGEALDLRTRHPKLWKKVIAGTVRVWEARKICSECAHLPLETVLVVDEAMAASDIGGLPFNRMMKALEGQIVAADTDLARERAEAQRASRRIRVSKVRDGCMSIFGIVDPADGINFNQLLTDIATALPVKPDTALCKDLDRRRNLAFSMIVRDAYAKAHGQEPVFESRFGEPVELPPGRLVELPPRTPVTRLPDRVAPRPGEPSWVTKKRERLIEQLKALDRRTSAPQSGPKARVDMSDPDGVGESPVGVSAAGPPGGLRTLESQIPQTVSDTTLVENWRSAGVPYPVSGPGQAGSYPRGDGPEFCGPIMPGPALPGPVVAGPVLYDTPAAAQLAGIAGAPNPVKHTLVIHISADDPALRAAGTPSVKDAGQPSTQTASQTGVARIEGWGPLLTEQLPEFLAGSKVTVRPVIDPAGMRPVDCYETPNRMRFAIEQRNPVDVFPFGTIGASHCDMDHTVPFVAGEAGQTHPGNLGPLSRTAHRAKTHGGWKLEQPEPGVFQWTSPHGYQYRVTAAGTTRIVAPDAAGQAA